MEKQYNMSNTQSLQINAELVKRLISSQFPEWQHLPIKTVAQSGWDNRTFHSTYHPVRMASKFFKSIGRITKGIFLLIGTLFNKPKISFPKILGGIVLEICALLINIFNVFFFLIPDIIKGIILGIIFNLIG